MRIEDLGVAIKESERFLTRAKEMRKLFKNYPEQTWYHAPRYQVESAACKRASMDLTRALAKMRKG